MEGTWYEEGFMRQFSTSTLSKSVLDCVCLHGARWDNVEISREEHLGLWLMPKEEPSASRVSSPHGCTVEDCMRMCREDVGAELTGS